MAMTDTPTAATRAGGPGHTVTFRRELRLHSVLAFGLAYLAPIIVLGTFGVISQKSNGGTAGSYLIAMLAMLLTATSYGRLSHEVPMAGSAYTYVRKMVSNHLGFLVGWGSMLDYVFIPMVIWLIGASYLNAQFPAIPDPVWIAGFIVITSGLNIVGIKVADHANLVLLAIEVLVIALFVAFSIYAVAHHGQQLLSLTPFTGKPFDVLALSAGAATAAYSFLGFDAVTTLTEETVNAKRTIPRAIMLTALVGGGIFVVATYATELVHPLVQVLDIDSAAFEIAKAIGGAFLSTVFLVGLIVGQFASGIAAQASASRLMFAMGRDGVLPKRFFGRLSPRTNTPINAILVVAAVGIIGCFLDISTSTSFINFGAFIAFTMVNVSAISLTRRQIARGEHVNPLTGYVVPALGALVVIYLITELDLPALLVGGTWLFIGICVLVGLTHGFHRPPPEMTDSTEMEELAA
ncbi:Amino acid permease. Membran protein [Propionibacterium freudenreichii]|uniref:APC family permease n=1 Tax=Propionibacterium freudenreichii TaxID=1744 RepID=UPI0005A5CA7D|nr:APC family permease [Propionibacterium freudenreichii]CEI27099.1 Amino acid permease. Membran protein [Propionibacterium freudenreichii]